MINPGFFVSNSGVKNNLFIGLGGQSNAVGFQYDYDTNTHPKIPGRFMFEPVSQTWQQLQKNVNNSGDYITFTGTSGCEFNLLNNLYNHYKKDICMLKYAHGGIGLGQGSSTPDWSEHTSGGVYSGFKISHQNAIATFPGNVTKMEWFIWVQGEQDTSNSTYANSYQANLISFFAKLRLDLALPNLKIIIVKLGSLQTALDPTNKATIRVAQEAVGAMPNNFLVSADGLVTETDNLHYNRASQNTLGDLIFQIIKANR